MAPTVDKAKKRQAIALSCLPLILEHNISDIPISKLAQAANIGKGTIYEYFTCKEDIVVELMYILQEQYMQDVLVRIEKQATFKEKLKTFFLSLYEDKYEHYRLVLKIFIGISYYKTNSELIAFQERWYEKNTEHLQTILENAIHTEKLKSKSSHLINGILNTYVGFLLSSLSKECCEIQKEVNEYIDTLFEFICEH